MAIEKDDKGISQILSTTNLEFDPKNPRFPKDIASSTDDVIVEKMVRDERLAELIQSIGLQGFFSGEPLLVTSEGTDKGKYYVVEGNRRLAALKILNGEIALRKPKPSLNLIIEEAREKPTEIPCIVFKTRSSILRYLGFRHITGIKSWPPLAKSRYLQQLRDDLYSTLPEDQQNRMLAKEIGSRSDYVGQMLSGLALYDKAKEKDFYDIPKIGEDKIDFTLLTTAISYANISSYIGLKSRISSDVSDVDDDKLRDLFVWIYSPQSDGYTIVKDSRRLKNLAAIVLNDNALKHLKKYKDLNTAYLLSEGPKNALYNLICEAYTKLQAAYEMIPTLDKVDKSHEEKSKETFDMAKHVKNMVQGRIEDE